MNKLADARFFNFEYVPVDGVPTNTHVAFWKRKVNCALPHLKNL